MGNTTLVEWRNEFDTEYEVYSSCTYLKKAIEALQR